MGAPTHWLRTNDRVWTPRHVGFFDTETRWSETEDGQLHTLRLWTLATVDRRPDYPAQETARTTWGTTPDTLADALVASLRGVRTRWLWAHNLAFDVSAAGLIDALCARGLVLADVLLVGRSSRVHMKRGEKSLWLLDSWSWLGTSLEQVGLATGRRKTTMPTESAPEADWVDYCMNDTVVLADAMLTLLAWWDRLGLGSFSRSGPACGWNALRHMTRKRTFLVRTDADGPQHDRRAIRGGRRDATRVGHVYGGPFAVLDFEHAYLDVARHARLPTARLGFRPSIDPRWLDTHKRDRGAIAECELFTEAPRYPLRIGGDTFYPVGHFRTVLAQPEIALAAERHDLVRIGPGYTHQLGYPLAPWGERVKGWLTDDSGATPAVAQLVAKQWSRSVVGKFAGRSSTVRDCGPALFPHGHLERGTAGPDHTALWDLHLAGRHWLITQDRDGDNAYPAVLAFVESYVRAALSRVLDALGDLVWVSADTDGMIVDLARGRRWLSEHLGAPFRPTRPERIAEALCDALEGVSWPCRLRPKLIAPTLDLAGPQHFRAGEYVRASGRAKAEPGPPGTPERRLTWPGLAWQLEHGRPGGYLRVEQSWTDPGITVRRWVLKDGTCVPPRAVIGADGVSRLVDWPDDARSAFLGPVADTQANALLRAVRRP